MSLRGRLLAGLLALVAVGLVVSDIALYRGLQSFLLDRVDQQLFDSREPVSTQAGIGRSFRGGRPQAVILDGTYAERVDHEGDVLWQLSSQYREHAAPAITDALRAPSDGTRYATVPSADREVDYRVLASPLSDGGTFLVALPLEDVQQTLSRMVVIEVIATVGVLVLLGLLAFWVVRVGLRPLTEIEHTAGAIAAGDLSRRVDRAEPKTEVGRLGLALNAMLAQIQHAFEEKESSEQRLRQFVGDASHELRTPLTSIRGYAELFRIHGLGSATASSTWPAGAPTPPSVELMTAMRRIEEEAERMGVLVDDLLLLARLDQGRPLEREPVDLVRIAADAVADARAADPDRPITLTDGEPVTVIGDEGRLRQVAANLLANARQHTPPETPVHVTVRAEDGGAVLEVADEGPGLNAEEARHVFERFYRADPARTRGGSGLGLSIVSAIATAHGGEATVESAPGGGARFRVVLPAEIHS